MIIIYKNDDDNYFIVNRKRGKKTKPYPNLDDCYRAIFNGELTNYFEGEEEFYDKRGYTEILKINSLQDYLIENLPEILI